MIRKNFHFDNYVVTVHQCNNDDSLPWHSHPVEHSHGVFCGQTLLEIEGQPKQEITSPSNLILPANIPHQITALEDNTIFVNVIKNGS